MKRTHASLLVADNKDINDLLSTEAGVFNRRRLVALALARGIVLSKRDSREDLVRYLSLLSYDRRDLDALLDAAAPTERHHPYSIAKYDIDCELDELVRIAETIRDERAERHDEVAQAQRRGGSVVLRVTYSELDTSRTRLQQKRDKEAIIEFERVGGGLQVRSTPGQKSEIYIGAIIAKVGAGVGIPDARLINFSGLREATARTAFFLQILTKLEVDHTNLEVNDVRVNKLPDLEDDGDEEGDDDGVSDHTRAIVASELRNASLEGTNVLTTPVYRNLERAGYFITKMVWSARNREDEQAIAEAWFNDGPNCSDFRYRVRGAAKGALSEERRKTWLIALEKAAEAAFQKVVEDYAANEGSDPDASGPEK